MDEVNEDLQKRTLDMGVKSKAHTWQECSPIVLDGRTRKFDPQDEQNRAIRRIFNKLGQLDRIKFHQFTCQGRKTPAHYAVVLKIEQRLKDAGALQ